MAKLHRRHHDHIDGILEARDLLRHSLVDGSLQVLKIRGKPIDQVLEFVENDEPDALEIHKNANDWEAGVIMARLEAMLEQESPPSVAVITPFREQQQKIAHSSSSLFLPPPSIVFHYY